MGSRKIIIIGVMLLLQGCRGASVEQKFQNSASSNAMNKMGAPTVTTPVANPFYSTESITVSGECSSGNDVHIGMAKVDGSDLSESQVLCVNSVYQFIISKTQDATYNFSVYQVSPSKGSSPSVSGQWVRDSSVPGAPTVTSPTITPYYSTSRMTLAGGCTTGLTVKVSGALDLSTPCVDAAYSFEMPTMPDGMHDFSVSQVNLVGTSSPLVAQQWSSDLYRTVALYHFDSSTGVTADGSAHPPNTLVQLAGSAFGTGKFDQAWLFPGSVSAGFRVLNSSIFYDLTSTMTVESFVRHVSLANNTYGAIVSKTEGGVQNSFEFGVKRSSGTNYFLYFRGSQTGGVFTELVSASNLSNFDNDSFHHVAVTWDAGAVRFYYDGNLLNAGSLAGVSSFYVSTAPFRIGGTNSGNYLNAYLDEVRVSKVLRLTGSTYSVPTAAYGPED